MDDLFFGIMTDLSNTIPFSSMKDSGCATYWAVFFSGQGLHATLWEWNLGYGSDVITTLQLGTYNDPINLFSIFAVGRCLSICFSGVGCVPTLFDGNHILSLCASPRFWPLCDTVWGSLLYIFCHTAFWAYVARQSSRAYHVSLGSSRC